MRAGLQSSSRKSAKPLAAVCMYMRMTTLLHSINNDQNLHRAPLTVGRNIIMREKNDEEDENREEMRK